MYLHFAYFIGSPIHTIWLNSEKLKHSLPKATLLKKENKENFLAIENFIQCILIIVNLLPQIFPHPPHPILSFPLSPVYLKSIKSSLCWLAPVGYGVYLF